MEDRLRKAADSEGRAKDTDKEKRKEVRKERKKNPLTVSEVQHANPTCRQTAYFHYKERKG